MARKVFISVLGTSNYGECTYKKDEFELRTRFIQQATLEYHQQRGVVWDETSDIYILLTKEARERNWEVCKDSEGNVTNEQGLRKVLDSMGLKARVHDVDIKDGIDEEELWDIFNTVFGLLEDGDELYFDLTHGFRYLPMLILVLGNYAKFLKKTTVKAITYGNWEMSERGMKPAPIIDLLPLSALQDWTFAAANFVKNGDVSRLMELSHPQLSERLARSQGGDVEARTLNGFMRQLEKFIDEVRLCRGVGTYNAVSYRRMMDLSPNLANFIRPLTPIIENITSSLGDFSPEQGARNCFAAAKWCLNKGLYQQAVTELQEGIVTYFCDQYNIPIDDHSRREIINRAFKKKLTPEIYETSDEKEVEDKVNEIVRGGLLTQSLLASFADLTDIRNDYNHAGMRNTGSYPYRNPREANRLKKGIKRHIDALAPLFMEGLMPMPRILVNLSNHPSQQWSAEQKAAAAAYGERIEDIPFPVVDPLADENYIKEQAKICVRNVLKLARNNTVTVHIMGELCLTYNIIHELQAHGIRCIASTTERISETLPDGSRHVEFHFKRFREYGN